MVDFNWQLAHLAEMEVKHRCSQALELGLPLGGLAAKMLAQEWEGDVTIVMPATLAQVDQNVSAFHHTRNWDLNEAAIFCC